LINNWRLKPKEIDYDAYHTELVGPGSTRSDLGGSRAGTFHHHADGDIQFRSL
jgi:hypothetical protein